MNLIHKDFLIALANGADVEHKLKTKSEWFVTSDHQSLTTFNNPNIEFRIKPKTVKLRIEIPMPFVPKFGEVFWYFEPSYIRGVNQLEKDDDNNFLSRLIALGVYRTEEEAIQALAAQTAAVAKLLEGAK